MLVDLEHWWPLVRCGGGMWGDDRNVPSVKVALRAFLSKHRLNRRIRIGALPGRTWNRSDAAGAWVLLKENTAEFTEAGRACGH